MRRTTDQAVLTKRVKLLRRAIAGFLFATFMFTIVALLLFDAHAGISDVHVPYAGHNLLVDHKGLLLPSEPYTVDRGLGCLVRLLSFTIQTSILGAAGLIIWGLIKRRKVVVYLSIGWLILISYAGPAPDTRYRLAERNSPKS